MIVRKIVAIPFSNIEMTKDTDNVSAAREV